MADTKNYGLIGVGDDVQFGKGGGRLVYNTGTGDFRVTSDGSTLVHLQALSPVGDTDVATKLYVDDRAAGLDPKESVRCATTANIGTYSAGGGAAGNGQLTSVPASIDGVTLAEGDRVLVKNQSTPTQNGIYVVTATTTTLDRAADHNSNTEVSAGNFVFVAEGTVNSDSGWVLQGPDPLTINTSDLNWALFSTSGTTVAGNGLVKNGNVLDLDFSELSSVAVDTLLGSDEIIVQDGAVESRITVTNFLNTFDIPNGISTNGFVVRSAADTYVERTLIASIAASEEGIVITTGDGVSGNPSIGFDIEGTTVSGGNATNTDTLLLFDGTNNRQYTVTELANAPAFGGSSTSIADGDSSVTVADAGAGTITTQVDGATVILSNAASTTFSHFIDVEVDSATTAADIPVLRVSARSTGTPATGIGTSIEFETETAAGAPGNLEVGGLIATEATDLTSTSEDFDFVFSTMAAGAAAAERMRITSLGGVSATSFTASSLTDNRVLLAGASGLIEDDANFTFDGAILTLTAAMDIIGDLDVDNINLNSNTISITDVDGNLVIQPNGTGQITLANGSGEEILELQDTVSAVNGFLITAGATGVAPSISSAATGSETNVDIGFVTAGTGVLSVTAGTGNYEDNVTADDDIPNKKYVDDTVAATGGSGTVDSITGTVDLTSATTQNIGSATGIPADATVLSVIFDVTVASDAVTTVTIGDATNGAASYMTATENDPEIIGIYIADGRLLNGAGARQAQATVATAGTVGAATVIITFRHA